MGEGAILYLQIVKTLGIMCVILSIINIPLFMIYAGAGNISSVSLFRIEQVIDAYTLGNIGSTREVCSNTHIPFDAGPKLFPELTPIEIDVAGIIRGPPKVMTLRCPLVDDYIAELEQFGFLYKIDYDYDYFTSAKTRCEEVNEPNDAYNE